MRSVAAEKDVTDPRYATAKNNALKQQRRIDHERDDFASDRGRQELYPNVDIHSVDRSTDGFPKTTLWSRVFQNRV